MTSNDTNNYTIDESVIGQPYKGPVKMIWKDGQRIQVPDYNLLDNAAASNAANNSAPPFSPYVYQKKLDDVLSSEDKDRFKNLRTDEEKYDFVRNLIGGTIDNQTEHHLWNSDIAAYVNGDRRPLEDILQDLLDRKILYMDPITGNLFLMSYAIQEHMIPFPCRYCSRVLYSENERINHSQSHISARR